MCQKKTNKQINKQTQFSSVFLNIFSLLYFVCFPNILNPYLFKSERHSSTAGSREHIPTTYTVHNKERGARCVMVIVVGNGHGNTSSNPGRDWLHFT